MEEQGLRAVLFFPRRILWLLLSFLAMTAILFAFSRTAMGEPGGGLERGVTPEQAEALRRELGLDKPLAQQYTHFMSGLVRGDLGRTLSTRRPVREEISERLPYTLRLLGLAILVGGGLSLFVILLGSLALLLRQRIPWPGAIVARLGQIGVASGVATPVFLLGLFLLYLFALQLGWFPVSGVVPPGSEGVFDLGHAILPALTLGILPACLVARFVLGELVHFLSAWSASRGTVLLHLVLSFLRSGLVQAIGMLGSVLLVELIFAHPGVGRLLVDAILRRDYPLALGLALTFLVVALILRALADLLEGVDGFVLPRLGPDRSRPEKRDRGQAWRWLWIALGLLLIILPLVQGVAGYLTYDETARRANPAERNLPPGSEAADGSRYRWGTDNLGRDLHSQARYAQGRLLLSSLLAAVVVLIPAALLGLVTGFLVTRRQVWADLLDDLLMFPVEVFTSLPGVVLLAFILATIGPGLENLLTWMILAFLLPRSVRFVRNWWATSSASTVGQRFASIVLGTLLLGAGLAIITQATFGFLGLGVQPPEPDLGALLQQGMRFLQAAPHILLDPGRALFFSTVGWFLLADLLLSSFGLYRREAWLELNR